MSKIIKVTNVSIKACDGNYINQLIVNTDSIVAIIPWNVQHEDALPEYYNGYLLLIKSYARHGQQNIEKYEITPETFNKIWHQL